MKRSIRVAMASIAFSFATVAAQPSLANAIYTYTGSNYTYIADTTPPAGTYTTAMNVTGTFTLASALPVNSTLGSVTPLSFSFFDGRNTFSDTSPDLFSDVFNIATDGTGNISNWLISIERGIPPSFTPYFNLLMSNPAIPGGPAGQIYDQGYFTDNPALGASNRDQAISAVSPGTWTVASVPEPSTLAFFGAGLLVSVREHIES